MTGPETELVEVSVNLRRASATFVDRLSQEMGVDVSESCRQIIDLMLNEGDVATGGASGTEESLAALRDRILARLVEEDGPENKKVRAQPAWTKRTIAVERKQFRALTILAEDNGRSTSRTIRHLIAGFMERSDQLSKANAGSQSRKRSSLQLSGDAAARSERARQGMGARRAVSRSPLRWFLLFALLLGAVAASGLFFTAKDLTGVRSPHIVASPPWAGRAAAIVFDHHSHTRYSDGSLSVPELVDLAREGGCDALAITDHSGSVGAGPSQVSNEATGAASNRQRRDFREIRQRYRDFILFGGVEITMPSHRGREHVSVIVAPTIEDEALPRLRDAARSAIRASIKTAAHGAETGALDKSFLDLAASYIRRGHKLVMIHNHPSRKDRDPRNNHDDILRWNADEEIFIGFAGASGHQNGSTSGSGRRANATIDRWDPVVAEIGGVWDRLLSEGHQIWGAIAGSDYHNSTLDKAPCAFSRTHVAAPDVSYDAVLQALQAGTFWADHGRILRGLSLSAEIAGLRSPAYPGSIVSLGGQATAVVTRISLRRGPGSTGKPLQAEFIGNCKTGQSELLSAEPIEPGAATAILVVEPKAAGADGKSCFIRARIRLVVEDGPDLMAYTNSIRFEL